MLHNNVTSNTINRDFLFALCNISVELQRTFSENYEMRSTRNASARSVIPYNPFNIINNFRRICAREVHEVNGD